MFDGGNVDMQVNSIGHGLLWLSRACPTPLTPLQKPSLSIPIWKVLMNTSISKYNNKEAYTDPLWTWTPCASYPMIHEVTT